MDILLVHGAFHDERCWDQLVPLLNKMDFNVHTLSLPGHTDSNAFGVSMKTYADAVCKKAKEIARPVVLLGHSMSGLVISMAGEMIPQLFSDLIYLCAYVPQKLDKLKYIAKKYSHKPFQEMLTFPLQYILRSYMYLDKKKAVEVFYNEIENNEQLLKYIRPQPLFPYFSRIEWSKNGLEKLQKHYIECEYDNAIPIEHQREMQNNMVFTGKYSLKSNHSPFFHKPNELAEIIEGILLAGIQYPTRCPPRIKEEK